MLSGGERSRLALAKLIASDANLLFLDEPTNHLDIASRESLEASLAEFSGAMIVVSHDRALIDRLAERLIIVQEGQAQLFYGNFSDYRRAQQMQPSDTDEGKGEEQSTLSKAAEQREQNKAREREERRLKRRREQLESEISDLESEIGAINERFANLDPTDYECGQELKLAYEQAQHALEKLYEDWMQLAG